MRTTASARRGTRATTACRGRRRVVPRDAGHRGQRVLSRLSGPEREHGIGLPAPPPLTLMLDQRETGNPSTAPPVMVVGLGRHDARSDVLVARWCGVFAELHLACLHLACLHQGVPHNGGDQGAWPRRRSRCRPRAPRPAKTGRRGRSDPARCRALNACDRFAK